MELVASDILGDVCQLSAVFSGAAVLVGVVLWLAGWATHRFWVVLSLTILGGVVGLQHAVALRATPLVAAIGIGLATGLLALTAVRLGAFFAGGYAALVLIHSWAPSWDQPLVSFLSGGLIGWLLFRYWTMVLTSFLGVILMLYGSLAVLEKLGRLEAVEWAEGHVRMLNTLGGVLAVTGFLVQLCADWLRNRSSGGSEEASKKDKKDDKKSKPATLLAAGLAAFRRAG